MITMTFNIFNEIKIILAENPSNENLQQAYTTLKSIHIKDMTEEEKKLLGEICFLLAESKILKGDSAEEVSNLAEESISLYKELNLKTKDECLPILSKFLPDFMHEGVVESRLSNYLKD